jgi:hypothetical protein
MPPRQPASGLVDGTSLPRARRLTRERRKV